ncbi:hypothetical protein HXX76_001706 [Chlamydomonas incerta]|uniref:Uncharacterized protein n=1 Tax=Chlamydomonas incerta TaxID=51695 RepID=A0A835TME4_CHLIN|nr:hypothetical protein HXX76_001706 [Chlamydomonas incerta]|eukprot:KAG2443344.1 hypothetical protein HXX76_001706 [Chlamydomonas incerta]
MASEQAELMLELEKLAESTGRLADLTAEKVSVKLNLEQVEERLFEKLAAKIAESRGGAPGAAGPGEVAAPGLAAVSGAAVADRQLSALELQTRSELMMRVSSLINAQPASDEVGLHKQVYKLGVLFATAQKEAVRMGQSALATRLANAQLQGFQAAHDAMAQLGTHPRNGMSVAVTIGVRSFTNAWNEDNWLASAAAPEIAAAERTLKQQQDRDTKGGGGSYSGGGGGGGSNWRSSTRKDESRERCDRDDDKEKKRR